MTNKFFYIASCFLFLSFNIVFAQKGTVKGTVTDAKTKESLPNASVLFNGTGMVTDIEGNYSVELNTGEQTLTFQFLGFETIKKTVTIEEGKTITLDVALKDIAQTLGPVVVTGGQYEQRIEEVTMSMEVIRPDLATEKAATSIQTAVNQTPGVQIVDSEPQIRGGSGYNFGAGSRVMILIDDVPLLSGDAGRPSWGFLPIENLEQIEVLKGAASVLYGSSALSGVINIRTAYPDEEPLTKINVGTGVYDNPATSYAKPWVDGNNPTTANINFFHSRRIGNLDLVWGGNLNTDEGTIGPEPGGTIGNFDRRARTNLNLRYRSKKIKGLSFGVNSNWQVSASAGSLLVLDVDSGFYTNFPGSQTVGNSTKWYIDPYITYARNAYEKHSIKTRWYNNGNSQNNNQSNRNDWYYGAYQYYRKIKSIDLNLTAGLTASKTYSISQLYQGNEDGSGESQAENQGAYIQLEKKFFDRLNVSAGARYERFKINNDEEGRPVFRAGFNYKAAEYTFIRASWGQGYRFPTIAEKYISTQVGPIRIFPNFDIQSETSWNAEVGIKQGVKIGEFKGYVDAAIFRQQVQNAVEFNFGQYGTTGNLLQDLGFKSINIKESRIQGYEASFAGKGAIGDVDITVLAGYTFIHPYNLHPNDTITELGNGAAVTYASSSVDTSGILKYRYEHMVKSDISFKYKKFTLGVTYNRLSWMKNYDKVFIDLDKIGLLKTGIAQYREDTQGQPIEWIDLRLLYDFNENFRISLITNNAMNVEYMIRPLDASKPRKYLVQFSWKF